MFIFQINHIGSSQENKPLFEVMRMSDGKRSPAVALTPPSEVSIATHNTTLKHGLRWYLEDYLDMPISAYCNCAEDIQIALKNWGLECFNTLFSDHALNWYYEARKSGLTNLTIKIASNDPAVLSWPWEALYSNDDEYIAQQCRIERQLSNIADVRPFTNELPSNQLNILYVIARPVEHDIGFQTLARPLVDFVVEGNWPVQVDVLRPPTFDRLREVLREKRNFYHIVHFDGHGSAPENVSEQFAGQAGTLLFEKENDLNHEGELVSADKLSALLREYNIPYMVLNACQSAMMDETNKDKDPFTSVAASLLRAGIRGVVAMSYSLWVEGAQAFVPAFYKRLFEEGDIAEAIRAGRQGMFAKNVRSTFIEQTEFNDWIVPVLYHQTTNEQILPKLTKGTAKCKNHLPMEVQQLLHSDFIGRSGAIHQLEHAMRQKQAGILIHGMVGEGKTTLIQGFLQWLEATGGLNAEVLWFDFEDIHSVSDVINKLADRLLSKQAMELPVEEKLPAIIKALVITPIIMVWDNFELASGYGNIKGLLSSYDCKILKDLLRDLRGGMTKVFITSSSCEEWLENEYIRISLLGLRGLELWHYCNHLINEMKPIEPHPPSYEMIINKLNGNPLAIRKILALRIRCQDTLLKYYLEQKDFQMIINDNTQPKQLLRALEIFSSKADELFVTIFKLVGLHEMCLDVRCIASMLELLGKPSDNVSNYFFELEKAGWCISHNLRKIYEVHPFLCIVLNKLYPASEAEQKAFATIMSSICSLNTSPTFYNEIFISNFHNALQIAKKLHMQNEIFVLLFGLGITAYNNYELDNAENLFQECMEAAKKFDSKENMSSAYHELGLIKNKQNDNETAINYFKKSLDIDLKLNNIHGVILNYKNLIFIAVKMKNQDTAKDLCIEAHKLILKINEKLDPLSKFSMAERYYELSKAMLVCPDSDVINIAWDFCDQSLKLAIEFIDETFITRSIANFLSKVYEQMAHIASSREDFDTAREMITKSWDMALINGNGVDKIRISASIGRIAELAGDISAAEEWYKNSWDICSDENNEYEAAFALSMMGRLAWKQGDFNKAENLIEMAIEIYRKYGKNDSEMINKELLNDIQADKKNSCSELKKES
jgi:tetratricopeptide (TPR) repeat protein